ncbi:MAG TPA: CPBP family intramembrane glutamic endopeptidase [Thermoplasmata archaeon]|nr:CPBP family intramembrane glutamic endopeptidase [Thermoplasmata archaeon]
MDAEGARAREGRAPRMVSGTASLLVAYLIALVIGEAFAARGEATLAIAVHLAVLFALVFHGATLSSREPALARFLTAMTLAPTLRVLSLSVPFWRFTIIQWLAIMTVPLLAACYAILRALPLTRKEVGLTLGPLHGLPSQVGIALTGIPLGAAEFLLLRPTAWIADYSAASFGFAVLAIALATGLAEELIFRGILQQVGGRVLGPTNGLLYVTAVFAALHLGSGSIADVGFAFAVGLLYAWLVLRTRTLSGVVVAHTLINVMLYLVVPGFV